MHIFTEKNQIESLTNEDNTLGKFGFAVYANVSFTITFISNLLVILVRSYLCNVSLAKQCILSYLYRDVLLAWMVLISIWELGILSIYWTGYGVGLDMITSKVLGFLLNCSFVTFLLLMDAIGVLTMYIIRAKTIDPWMPWGDDESRGLKMIHAVCIGTSILFTLTMYILGIYPISYYFFLFGGNIFVVICYKTTIYKSRSTNIIPLYNFIF